ncbi:MAG: DUF4276 family protein [Chloroflexi bacterium]|nr:DUF4276 family protein [Chloroflexota bacterium]MCI0648099.1 DUF4276 family protein [Chloroflexota bacterium]
MKRVLILVEGLTEETFVNRVLAPHLRTRDVEPIPTLVKTKRTAAGPHFKGGLSSYGKVKNDVVRLLNDSDAAVVTTMLDFYALPRDFPGMNTLPRGNCYTRVAHLEKSFAQDIDRPAFFPYLSLHEFEALLFVDVEKIALQFTQLNRLNELVAIRQAFKSPEEIDDNPKTAPSKRLESLFPEYNKPLHGTLIALEIGLDAIRKECRHFNTWLARLEAAGGK